MKMGLGKGLDALFEDNTVNIDLEFGQNVKTVAISNVEPNRNQPRKNFSNESMAGLADSIREHGVLTPLLVSPLGGGRYMIIAGERRWRAARIAGLSEIPVIIKEISDNEILQLSLIENLQREDLNPIEEATGYKALVEDFGFTQEKIAEKVSKSRSVVANALRLLTLPDQAQEMVKNGKLSSGHARAVLSCSTKDKQLTLAKMCIEKDLTVRQAEKLAKESKPIGKQVKLTDFGMNFTREYEDSLKNLFSRKVKITSNGEKGAIEFKFHGADDFEVLINQLGVNLDD